MRRPSIFLIVLCMSVACLSSQSRAQVRDRLELGANYEWTRANAPAGQCVCFSLNGGTGTVAFSLPAGLSAIAEISGNHASNLGGSSQSVTTYTYLAGGRYSLPAGRRGELFGEVLLGATHEASNYAYVADSSAFTVGVGGGVRVRAGQHLGFNIGQLDWLHSDLPNGSNNRQNDLRISTGLYLRFGVR